MGSSPFASTLPADLELDLDMDYRRAAPAARPQASPNAASGQAPQRYHPGHQNLDLGNLPTLPAELGSLEMRPSSPHALRAASSPEPEERTLRVYVAGFNERELLLLDGTVLLSQRRTPRLALVSETVASKADVILIDGADIAAVTWAESQRWLDRKAVIWVNSRVPRPGHTLARRPVQWPILPMMLARAMEAASARSEPAAETAAPAPVAARAATLAASDAPSNPHILIVDDSLAVRNHLRSLLEARGFQVSEAAHAQLALNALVPGRFACILMDVLMPDMDGYEACKRIKQLRSSMGVIPIVMLTSKSSPFDRIRGKMAGCDAYLTKPVEQAQLFEVLAKHAGGGRSAFAPTRAAAADEARSFQQRLDSLRSQSSALRRS